MTQILLMKLKAKFTEIKSRDLPVEEIISTFLKMCKGLVSLIMDNPENVALFISKLGGYMMSKKSKLETEIEEKVFTVAIHDAIAISFGECLKFSKRLNPNTVMKIIKCWEELVNNLPKMMLKTFPNRNKEAIENLIVAAAIEDISIQYKVFSLILFNYTDETFDNDTIAFIQELFRKVGYEEFNELFTFNFVQKEMELRKILNKFNQNRRVYSVVGDNIYINNKKLSPCSATGLWIDFSQATKKVSFSFVVKIAGKKETVNAHLMADMVIGLLTKRYEFGITLLFELQKEPYFSSSEVINMFGKIHEIKIDLTQSVDKPQTFLDEIRNWYNNSDLKSELSTPCVLSKSQANDDFVVPETPVSTTELVQNDAIETLDKNNNIDCEAVMITLKPTNQSKVDEIVKISKDFDINAMNRTRIINRNHPNDVEEKIISGQQILIKAIVHTDPDELEKMLPTKNVSDDDKSLENSPIGFYQPESVIYKTLNQSETDYDSEPEGVPIPVKVSTNTEIIAKSKNEPKSKVKASPKTKPKPRPKPKPKPKSKPKATTRQTRTTKSTIETKTSFKVMDFKKSTKQQTDTHEQLEKDWSSESDKTHQPKIVTKKRKLINLDADIDPPTAFNTPAHPQKHYEEEIISEMDCTDEEVPPQVKPAKKFFNRASDNLSKINEKRRSTEMNDKFDVYNFPKKPPPISNTASFSYRSKSIEFSQKSFADCFEEPATKRRKEIKQSSPIVDEMLNIVADHKKLIFRFEEITKKLE